ncbi:MAG: chorismate mutase [SAR86 cluster bacterium]|uniref:chorismate mutase n=1 Tax=SAR86 cluster bacterium TaxID=2030880 RepID=A0A2A5B3H9_9GAMM|nr:MAG: chorismate mutase [SAR86 cluster bacterium]
MALEPIPSELLEAREKIDLIDKDLVALLRDRFELTHQVGLLKASNALNAVDATRESQKLADLSLLCKEYNLNPELVTGLFSKIMEEVVKNHRQLRT